MIASYTRKSETILFVFALVFSLLVYGLLAWGGAIAVKGFIDARKAQAAELAAWQEESAEEPLVEGEPSFEGEPEAAPAEQDPAALEAILEKYTLPDGNFDYDRYFADLETDPSLAEAMGLGPEYADASGEAEGSAEDSGDYYDEGYGSSFGAGLASGSILVVMGMVLAYILVFALFFLAIHILAVGHLMGNGVRVGPRQFPELWAHFERAAAEFGVKRLPAFYLVESGGMLNAFATRLFTRNYVAIYADLAERLYEGDEDSVAFVIAHELVHVRRNHLLLNLLTLPAEIIPYLKGAWRRACEYSCDAGGAAYAPAGAEKGLVLLAAGKRLSGRVDVEAYLESFDAERSLWKRIAELASSHPHLPKRIKAVRKLRAG